ncbi:hypothetical protein LPJ64_006123 [Coemansia asiatica]|uniref:H/ACA ribonucleoprotein complex subunit n=1 Tax=Coemansia asiatica TaxID=1052880 RepID=A0A9W7XFV9_9FUNG|nr:hypothetical protein LPJ64_006123 [Coemansia asiatica]
MPTNNITKQTTGTDDEADNESSDLDSTTSSSVFDDSSDDEQNNRTLQRLVAEAEFDDEDDPMSGHTEGIPATRHEVTNPLVPALPIERLPETSVLRDLGKVHSIVDCSVTIQAHISGEKHVLDSDSLVVMEDRRVLGLIFDVFGPVSRPMYTVRFNTASEALEMAAVGMKVYFSQDWAKMLATERLRSRGTDASNMYDEEVSSDNMEFSDDEAERVAKQKRKKKTQESRRQTSSQSAAADSSTLHPAGPPSASGKDNAPGTVVGGRQLQSYGDLYDADLGF